MNRIKYKLENKEQITLLDIREQKQEVLREIRGQQDKVATRAENIIAPITATGSTLASSFNMGMIAFDTIRMGVRAIRRISDLFSRRRKR